MQYESVSGAIRCLGFNFFAGILFSSFFFREASVLSEGSNTSLEEFHVIRKINNGLALALTGGHAGVALLLSILVGAPVGQVGKAQGQDNDNKGSQDLESLGVFFKESGKTQEEQGNNHKHDKDVDQGESTPDTGGTAQTAGGRQGKGTHKGDGVEDADTRNVEEQVGKGNLERVNAVRHQGSSDTSHGGSDIGSERKGKHLFQTKGSHTNQRSQGGGGNGGRLDKHGNTGTNSNGKVSVDVSGLVDDTGGHTQKHLLKNGNNTQQACEQHHNGNEENNTSRNLVILGGGILREKGRAVSVFLVAGNQTKLLSAVGVGRLANTFIGVEFFAVSTLGNGLGDTLVDNNDALSKGRDNLLDRSFPLFVILDIGVLDHGLGQGVQVSSNGFHREQDSDSHKVEHIVNGGTGKGTFELISISHLSHGNNGVGDGSSDVGSHDHVDTLFDRDGSIFSSNKGDNNGGGGGGRLKKDSGKDTDHQSSNGVGVVTKKFSSLATGHDLGTISQKVQTEKEPVEQKCHSQNSSGEHGPFTGSVHAAGGANFAPGGIAVFIFGIKVGIAKVGGGTLLLFNFVFVGDGVLDGDFGFFGHFGL
mmetsp:Transcript_6075/g.17049  ORF Transcript_6075/g.17049 Transcript_6075/m.17049 type:complete len:590 (-) Transcript_6075:453-2222(-)